MAEPLRILILEDNPIDADLVQFELEEAGFTINAKVVRTEKDFIRELQDYCPDIILSDYDLPQYNGALALAVARERCPDTPFILVTGAVTEDRAIEILTKGAKDYVLKTRLQQRLVPAVRRALAEAEEHRARKQAEDELREAHRTLEERVKIRTAELEGEIALRKKVEEALRESEERYRVLFEGSTHGILAADIETKRFVFANPSICRMLGYSEGELLQLGIADLHPKDSLDFVMSEFNTQIRGKKPISSALPCLRKDGTVFYADIAGSSTIVQGRRCIVGFFADVTDRKLMENEKLRRSRGEMEALRERYFELYDLAPVGYFSLDKKGLILEANLTAARLLGVAEGELVGQPLDRFILPEDQDIYYLHRRGLFETGAPQTCEFRMLRKGAVPFWTRIQANMAPDPSTSSGQAGDGASVCRAVLSDISEQKRAEEALKQFQAGLEERVRERTTELAESEERFRSLVTATAQMVWTTDAAGNVVDDIPSWRAYTGQTVEQIRGARWAGALHPDDLPRTLAIWQRAVESRSFYDIENRVRRHDGQYRNFAVRGVPLQNADGSIREWVGYCADITERKQAEEEIRTLNRELDQRVEERTAKLRESEERFGVLFNRGTDAIFVHRLDDDGTLSNFVEVNDVACVRLGYSREELLQMSPADIDAPDALANIPVVTQRVLRDGALLFESAHMTKDGRRIPVEISGKRFLLAGTPMVISVARDITERKVAEAKLLETHELLRNRAAELETFNQVMVGREQRIIEIKEEVNALCQELGREPKYPPVWRKGSGS